MNQERPEEEDRDAQNERDEAGLLRRPHKIHAGGDLGEKRIRDLAEPHQQGHVVPGRRMAELQSEKDEQGRDQQNPGQIHQKPKRSEPALKGALEFFHRAPGTARPSTPAAAGSESDIPAAYSILGSRIKRKQSVECALQGSRRGDSILGSRKTSRSFRSQAPRARRQTSAQRPEALEVSRFQL